MKKNKEIFLKITAATLGLLLFAPNAGAQTSALKKAVEDIKDSVDLLIGAKDSENESLAFRLETFKKVIDLATAEAKDLKVRILVFETKDKDIEAWKEEQIEKLNAIIEYYAGQEETIDSQKEISFEDLKATAQEFKIRRESDFRLIAEETTEFFLIQQENKAIETTEKRLEKINKDIDKLKNQKIKNIKRVDSYLEKAEKLIAKSAATNDTATRVFWENFRATSSEAIASTTASIKIENNASSTDQANPSSANVGGDETALKHKEPSIKDLVYASLNDLKGAYQNFIDLSNLVRELLK